MKMPFILKLIYATTILSIMIRVPTGIQALIAFLSPANSFSVQFAGAAFVSALACALALIVIWDITEKPRRAYFVVALYPILAILLYPAQNILVAIGLHTPPVSIPSEQLPGAAAFEMGRYLWFIFLFVWFRLSKSARLYLHSSFVTKPPPIPLPDAAEI